jgi:hypothetical protein
MKSIKVDFFFSQRTIGVFPVIEPTFQNEDESNKYSSEIHPHDSNKPTKNRHIFSFSQSK